MSFNIIFIYLGKSIISSLPQHGHTLRSKFVPSLAHHFRVDWLDTWARPLLSKEILDQLVLVAHSTAF